MKKRGQTLLEIIITVTIITIGLIPILSLVISSHNAQVQTREGVQATFLAQEAIEYAHNVRDTSINKGLSWFSNFSEGGTGFGGDGYYSLGTVTSNPSLKLLNTEKVNDGVNHTLDNIKFYRYINISKHEGSTDALMIKVEVTWPREDSDSPDGKITLSELITAWE
jgi:type II secretory pathway pseudopilin PulG